MSSTTGSSNASSRETFKAGYATPVLHVASIEKSIRFYQLLGFDTVDTDRAKPLGWARMHCEGGAVMFLRAEGPAADTSSHGALLYMYSPNLIELSGYLRANALEIPPIKYPEYMPSGEITLTDLDGNTICVAHWAKAEHDAWLKRIGVNT